MHPHPHLALVLLICVYLQVARVDAVMGVLGLTRSKDTIIGGYFRRGVSGTCARRAVHQAVHVQSAVLLAGQCSTVERAEHAH